MSIMLGSPTSKVFEVVVSVFTPAETVDSSTDVA